MSIADPGHRTPPIALVIEAAQAPQPDEPMTPTQLRERGRRLLTECLQVSADDPDVTDTIGWLIGEMTSVTEDVLVLMPADSHALADDLAIAHRALIRLMEDVERADAQAIMRNGLGARRGLPDRAARRKADDRDGPVRMRRSRSAGRCSCSAGRSHRDAPRGA